MRMVLPSRIILSWEESVIWRKVARRLANILWNISDETKVHIGDVERIARAYLFGKPMSEKGREVCETYRQGFFMEEIPELVGLPCKEVQMSVAKYLVRRELRRHKIPFIANCISHDLDNAQVRLVISLKKQRASIAKIAEATGKTPQGVHQFVHEIVQEHGKEIVAPTESLWTTAEVAAELGLNHRAITALCRKGLIPCKRRNPVEGGRFILTQQGVDALKKHVLNKETD